MPIVVGSYLFATFISGSAYYDPTLYCQVVGTLLYLPFIRPNIYFVVNKVC